MHQQAIDFSRQGTVLRRASCDVIILDGVRNDRWRILVGDDAATLDRMVRESPETAYDADFLTALQGSGHLQTITR
jgi:hypothetical protein